MGSEPTSILVFRNGSIGNTLAAVPALRALRKRYPTIPIAVVVDPLGAELLRHCPWTTHLIPYDKHGADRSWLAHWRLVRELRATRPSHAILFKRFFRNGLLAFLSGARTRIGFVTKGKAPFLTMAIAYEESVSVVDQNLHLVELMDVPSDGRDLQLFLCDEDLSAAEMLIQERIGEKSSYLTAHYGGSTTSPDFVPLSRMVALLRGVGKNRPTFLIGSGPRERQFARSLCEDLPNAYELCDLPIRLMAAVIRGAALFVGFNSGPGHVAAAVGTPAILLFRPDNRVEDEIRKWCPPGNTVRAMVPPRESAEDEWLIFVERAGEAVSDLVTPAESSHLGGNLP